MWCTSRIGLDLGCVCGSASRGRGGCEKLGCSSPCVYLRVESEDALVVATHQKHGWQVLRQSLQPGHIQSARHGALPGQRQTPA